MLVSVIPAPTEESASVTNRPQASGEKAFLHVCTFGTAADWCFLRSFLLLYLPIILAGFSHASRIAEGITMLVCD